MPKDDEPFVVYKQNYHSLLGQIPNADPSNARSVSPNSDASRKDQRVRTGLEDLLKMPNGVEEPFVVCKQNFRSFSVFKKSIQHLHQSLLTLGYSVCFTSL